MSNDSDDFLDLDGEDEGARRSAAQRLAEAQRLDGTYNPPVPERVHVQSAQDVRACFLSFSSSSSSSRTRTR